MQDLAVQSIRVALYARVSTEEQRDGQTIDSQISELDAFARDKGWPVLGVYKDDGWSGGLLIRPALDRLRDDASKLTFDAVLINDVDRLARDVSHLGIVKRDLERSGIKIIFKKLPTESSPTHNLMVNILGSFAEFERELILDRTRRGRRHKVEVRHEYLGCNAPYGYHYSPREKSSGKEGYLSVVPEEAAVVRQMFEWMDKEGLSARRVTARLNLTKIQPRHRGSHWAKSSALRIVRSETYAGVWHYNKYEGCEPVKPSKEKRYRRTTKGSLRRRPKSEWIPVTLPEHLRIIDRHQWQRVQEQLDRNITFSRRNSKHIYLLSGLVECGGCGARYCGDPNHGRFYYRCYARCKRFSSVRDEILDELVWDAIAEAFLNPSLIVNQIAQRQKRGAEMREARQQQVQELEQARTGIDQEESRIIEAYRQRILSSDQLARELDQIKARRSALEARLLNVANKGHAPIGNSVDAITETCKKIARQLESFKNEERQRFLQLVVDRVVFEGNRIRIKAILPVANKESPKAELAIPKLRARKPIASDRIANLKLYNAVRNPASEVGFELTKFLPEEVPLKDKLTPELLRRLLQDVPRATLEQYSDKVRREYSLVISTTSLCRAFKRAGLDRHADRKSRQFPLHRQKECLDRD